MHLAHKFLILVAIIVIPNTNSYVLIKNPKSQLVLSTAAPVVSVRTYTLGDEKQLWTFETTLKGTYFIINKSNGQALQKDPDSNELITKPLSECKNQQWHVNSDHTIVNAESDRYLDIKGSIFENGTTVLVYEKRGSPNQNFVLEVV